MGKMKLVPLLGMALTAAASRLTFSDDTQWEDRIMTCAESTPWSALKTVAKERRTDLGKHIVRQVRDRIQKRGLQIQQGWEGLCSVVAVEYMLVMFEPDRFANIVADLFCNGYVGQDRGIQYNISASKTVLECMKSSGAESKGERKKHRSNFDLFRLQDSHNTKINAVDWIFSAPFADALKPGITPCANRSGQAQAIEDYTKLAAWIFPSAAIKLQHARLRSHWLASGTHRHLQRDEWARVLRTVQAGGQVILRVSTTATTNSDHKASGHAVVLTAVLTENRVEDSCAKVLLKAAPACVIWSWGKYYVFESCDNLRKVSGGGVLVPAHGGYSTAGPDRFLQGKADMSKIVKYLRHMWYVRRVNYKPKEKGNFDSVAPDYAGEASWPDRGFNFEGRAGGKEMLFVPRILIGSKQQKNGNPEERFKECELVRDEIVKAAPGYEIAAPVTDDQGLSWGGLEDVVLYYDDED